MPQGADFGLLRLENEYFRDDAFVHRTPLRVWRGVAETLLLLVSTSQSGGITGSKQS
jgi:hypothetical protein